MIPFLVKAVGVLSALVQLVKAVVVIVIECKKAYAEVLNKVAETNTVSNTVSNTAQAEQVEEVEVANASTESRKVFSTYSYPEVDLTMFEGKMFSWAPDMEPTPG
jgi:hypothetical protein